MVDNLILRVIAKVLIPVIMLFALYVQFHGDYSPGGGFQAGVIFSSAMLLYALVFGLDAAAKILTDKALVITASLGVLLYAGTGVASLILGGTYLDYGVLASTPLAGQHIGIIVIELGVGLTVAAIMVLIFFTFARRTRAV
ncbi:Na(+)/H(+) antiporter subunit B [Aliiglaciecola sp. LCG003]|uniref:Na(+)/H(+) antiporter subunit B n=1 Tax=Aliiglaciecola sp. LCG003 TaxID=3053655 RepID=UPI002573F711|nr:Na(+)/H(+) antiporter subunit B [Aliiglaciecola sp. LCG003]WJG08216.1 Na(+)/H(+) antiporter subunit B [Aliiglaciecola sp. LCG003]